MTMLGLFAARARELERRRISQKPKFPLYPKTSHESEREILSFSIRMYTLSHIHILIHVHTHTHTGPSLAPLLQIPRQQFRERQS